MSQSRAGWDTRGLGAANKKVHTATQDLTAIADFLRAYCKFLKSCPPVLDYQVIQDTPFPPPEALLRMGAILKEIECNRHGKL